MIFFFFTIVKQFKFFCKLYFFVFELIMILILFWRLHLFDIKMSDDFDEYWIPTRLADSIKIYHILVFFYWAFHKTKLIKFFRNIIWLVENHHQVSAVNFRQLCVVCIRLEKVELFRLSNYYIMLQMRTWVGM